MAIRRVQRIALDGTTVSATFGTHLIPLTKASYGDKLDTGILSNMGSQTIDARTRGTYSTEDAKLSMDAVVFRALFQPLLQKSGFGNEVIPIVIGYAHPDLGDDSDLLDQARIVIPSITVENSSKPFEVEITCVFNQLYLGNNRVTLNAIDPSVPLAASKF